MEVWQRDAAAVRKRRVSRSVAERWMGGGNVEMSGRRNKMEVKRDEGS